MATLTVKILGFAGVRVKALVSPTVGQIAKPINHEGHEVARRKRAEIGLVRFTRDRTAKEVRARCTIALVKRMNTTREILRKLRMTSD